MEKNKPEPTIPQGIDFDGTNSAKKSVIHPGQPNRPISASTKIKEFFANHTPTIIVTLLIAFCCFVAKTLYDLNGTICTSTVKITDNKENIDTLEADIKVLEKSDANQNVDIGKMKYRLKID